MMQERRIRHPWLAAAGLALMAGPAAWLLFALAPPAPAAAPLELAAAIDAPMPTGVAVSAAGRLFLCFPRWGDPVAFTVAEIRDGAPIPYPNAAFNAPFGNPRGRWVSVQSVVVDARDRLWVLDTGIDAGTVVPGGAKLACVDLATDRVVHTITFPGDVLLATTYLNDVRFDLKRGAAGIAYITDSSPAGPNAIIVVDLASGAAWRRLNGHRSTRPDTNCVPVVEGEPLAIVLADSTRIPFRVGADGIALAPDGKTLYYCPLTARRLYAVSADALAASALADAEVARTVRDLGEKPASDGLEMDADGTLYATAYELDAILRRTADGRWDTLAADPRLQWPDSIALTADGHLLVTANQLHRQPMFHGGRDRRHPPYAVFRIPIR